MHAVVKIVVPLGREAIVSPHRRLHGTNIVPIAFCDELHFAAQAPGCGLDGVVELA
jgi:hypothetical protein